MIIYHGEYDAGTVTDAEHSERLHDRVVGDIIMMTHYRCITWYHY